MRYSAAADVARAIALAILLVAPAPTRAQRVETVARILASSEVEGRFAHPVCYMGETLRPADAAAYTYALVRLSRDPDRPMVLDTGGLLTPHGVARYAAGAHPELLAGMVRELGYRALAFGMAELDSPRDDMLAVAAELRERGIPMIASNVRCGAEAQGLCDAVVDAGDEPSIHEVADRRMAVLAVVRADAPAWLAPDRARGISIEPPARALARLTTAAREAGAEIVAAVVDSGIEGGPVELAASLPEDARPDLLLVSGGSELLFARPRAVHPVVIGAPLNDAVEVLIRESDALREGYEMLAQPIGGRGITVGEPVLDFIEQVGPDYCEAWGRPLEGGHLERPIDNRGMLELASGVLRRVADADVAVLNPQILEGSWEPAHEGALTASDVYVAIEYDEPLRVAEVDAAWLQQLARVAASQGLVTPGLTWSGDGSSGVKVEGHPLEGRATYRVVTTRYLAEGAGGQLPALPRRGRWQRAGDETVRSAVLAYLEAERPADPRDALPDPEGTIQWIFRTNADLTFSGSAIGNPRRRCAPDTPPQRCVDGLVVTEDGLPELAYGTSLLNREDTVTFGVAIDLAADAAAPDWTWQNSINLLYRTAWIETAPGFAEAADQIRGRSALAWRGLRRGNEGWYVPDPMLDLFVETELTEPADRNWHWFLVRPTAGVRFQLLDKLQLQLLGGFEVQPFSPDVEVEPGVGATLTLAPWDLLRFEDRYARVSFTFDYFLADLGDDNRSQLRGQLDASFDLAGPLALVMSFRIFVQDEVGQDLGIAVDATAGLRLGYLGRATGP